VIPVTDFKENRMQFLFLCVGRIGVLSEQSANRGHPRHAPCSCRRGLARATWAGVSPLPCLIEGPRPRACPICSGFTMQLFLPSLQINRLSLNGAFFLSNCPVHGGWKERDLLVCSSGIEASQSIHVEASEMSVLCRTEILTNYRTNYYLLTYLPSYLMNCLLIHPSMYPSVRLSVHPAIHHSIYVFIFQSMYLSSYLSA
jgi:hypothetical protein